MSELRLAEAIAGVREELMRARDDGKDSDVRFEVGPVEVEFAIDVSKSEGGEAAIKVLSLLSIGGKHEVSRGYSSTVKVTLNPMRSGGAPFEVGSESVKRPDGAAGR